jgi:hypothetical protein
MAPHHTINGCNLRSGDVLATGTISGPSASESGAMMEFARKGMAPVSLATGEDRSFAEMVKQSSSAATAKSLVLPDRLWRLQGRCVGSATRSPLINEPLQRLNVTIPSGGLVQQNCPTSHGFIQAMRASQAVSIMTKRVCYISESAPLDAHVPDTNDGSVSRPC